MFERIKFVCKCGCSFEINRERLAIAERLKCPNLCIFEGQKELFEALKKLERVYDLNTEISFKIGG